MPSGGYSFQMDCFVLFMCLSTWFATRLLNREASISQHTCTCSLHIKNLSSKSDILDVLVVFFTGLCTYGTA